MAAAIVVTVERDPRQLELGGCCAAVVLVGSRPVPHRCTPPGRTSSAGSKKSGALAPGHPKDGSRMVRAWG